MSNAQYLASLVNSSGNIVLPVSNGGVVFNPSTTGTGTTLSNTMADYETGTFTPAFSASGYTFTYNNQFGVYTKIGNFVSIKIYLSLSYASGSGTVQGNITGLPFTIANTFANYGAGSICPDTGSAYLTTGGYTLVTRTAPNLTNFPILFGNGGNALKATLNWAGITANTEFEVSLQYQAST